MSECKCCDTDAYGNFVNDPCCQEGYCESDAEDKNSTIGYCIHCGGEMFKEDGNWYHHSQKEIPIEERRKIHYGI